MSIPTWSSTCPELGRQQAGFTLLETVLALALGVTLSLMVMSAVSLGRERRDLDTAARQIENALVAARSDAIVTGRTVFFNCDPSARTWWVDPAHVTTLPAGITMTTTSPVELARGAIRRIAFHGDGTSSGGRIGVARGTVSRLMDVNWMTASVSRPAKQ